MDDFMKSKPKPTQQPPLQVRLGLDRTPNSVFSMLRSREVGRRLKWISRTFLDWSDPIDHFAVTHQTQLTLPASHKACPGPG